jgi:hypothetical protein
LNGRFIYFFSSLFLGLEVEKNEAKNK